MTPRGFVFLRFDQRLSWHFEEAPMDDELLFDPDPQVGAGVPGQKGNEPLSALEKIRKGLARR